VASYKWSHTILTRAKAKPVKLFKSDAEKNFQRDIDAARTGCSSLTARLAVAELEVSERRDVDLATKLTGVLRINPTNEIGKTLTLCCMNLLI
jgi:hypothetical protein